MHKSNTFSDESVKNIEVSCTRGREGSGKNKGKGGWNIKRERGLLTNGMGIHNPQPQGAGRGVEKIKVKGDGT